MDSDLEHDLARLQDAVARIGATLLALEQDPTVQLLQASTLSGETAARWVEAEASRAALFSAYRDLGDVVERAATTRRPGDVVRLLRGPSVVRAEAARPLAERGLLELSRRVDLGTPDQLVADMADVFDDVRGVVAAVEQTWAEAIPWIRDGRRRLAEVVADAERLATEPPPALDGLAGELDHLAEAVLSDPLAWSSAVAGAIDARLTAAGEALATLRSVCDDWLGQLTAARALLASLADAVARTNEVVARATSRVAAVPSPQTVDPYPALAVELDTLAGRAGAAPWPEVAADLASWRARARDAIAELETRSAEHQSLLDRRNELRGRLDAYEAKAARLDRLEDAALAALRRQAHDVLYTAPTDLERADELVRRCSDALRTEAVRDRR